MSEPFHACPAEGTPLLLPRRVALQRLAGGTGGLALLLAGCGTPPPPKPTVVAATLKASANANPDLHKRPSPIVLRVYELKTTAAFDAADFLSLYERDQATLAAEMVSRDELILKPGDSKPWEKTVGAETRFIGVFAAFRDLDHARWKATIAVLPNQRNLIAVTADGLNLSVQKA